MAPCNGTQQWHHVHSTIAHYNGTLQWHPAMAPRPLHPAMAFWCHVQCAKVVRRPPPLLEVRTPIAIAIRGKNTTLNSTPISFWLQLRESTSRGVKKNCTPKPELCTSGWSATAGISLATSRWPWRSTKRCSASCLFSCSWWWFKVSTEKTPVSFHEILVV